MSRQHPDFDQLDDELHSLFAQATDHIDPQRDLAASVQQRLAQGESAPSAGAHRSRSIAATLSVFIVVALLVGVLAELRGAGAQRGGANGTGAPATTAAAATTVATTVPFTVTSVDLAVNPTSIAGTRCGTPLTVTYTATFHLAANGPGGTIRFDDTVNNGRGSTPASVTVAPGQTTASYSFQWSGALPADHTYPEAGGVIVQSPNAVNSSLLGPGGACS
jgi:hypothetical protein